MRSHIIALLLSLGASHAAFAAPSSTFDSGNDGWTVSDTNPPFDSFGGSFTPDYDEEGQFIRYTDPSAMSFFFERLSPGLRFKVMAFASSSCTLRALRAVVLCLGVSVLDGAITDFFGGEGKQGIVTH